MKHWELRTKWKDICRLVVLFLFCVWFWVESWMNLPWIKIYEKFIVFMELENIIDFLICLLCIRIFLLYPTPIHPACCCFDSVHESSKFFPVVCQLTREIIFCMMEREKWKSVTKVERNEKGWRIIMLGNKARITASSAIIDI